MKTLHALTPPITEEVLWAAAYVYGYGYNHFRVSKDGMLQFSNGAGWSTCTPNAQKSYVASGKHNVANGYEDRRKLVATMFEEGA